jgi:hypothetical protein
LACFVGHKKKKFLISVIILVMNSHQIFHFWKL